MPDSSPPVVRGRSTQLTPEQWAWLEERAARTQTFSVSAELRKIVQAEMERERRADGNGGRLAA